MRKIVLASVTAAAFLFACNLQQVANQLQANTAMIGTVLATPPIPISPAALGGFDASFPADSGFPSDAGTVTIPSQTAAYVYLGTLQSLSLTTPPVPISDAVVTLTADGGSAISLPGDGGGSYATTSAQTPALQYQSGATYDFTATEGGNTYVGEVSQAPDIELITAFHPAQGYIQQPAGMAFAFTRPTPANGQAENLGFVYVFPVDSNGNQGGITYTNVPQTPLGLLELIATPSDWKQPDVTIPGTAFPNPGTVYVMIFQSVKTGGPKSDDLFLGSALLAGPADVGILRTQ